jgi:hypothetical protein
LEAKEEKMLVNVKAVEEDDRERKRRSGEEGDSFRPVMITK